MSLSLGFASGVTLGAESRTIAVLWYTYSHPESTYRQAIEKLGAVVHTVPQGGGAKWQISFYGPDSPQPQFGRYNVLVIQSGEGQGSQHPSIEKLAKVDFSGILNHRQAIEAARGSRTVITGTDADVHAIEGATGHAPVKEGYRITCSPSFVGPACWDGAAGHLVNAVNWAAGGRGLGIVSLVAAEFPGSRWWLHPDSFLRNELSTRGSSPNPVNLGVLLGGGSTKDLVTIFGPGTRENSVVIPEAARNHPLNAGLTAKGLSNWHHSFHAGFSHALRDYVHIVNSTRYPDMALTIAWDKLGAPGRK